MLCPRCKSEIEDKSLKCSVCGSKVGTFCKDCGAYNPITNTNCTNCSKQLLRICDNCGAANMPEVTSCRKCGMNFDIETTKPNITEPPVYQPKLNSQQKVKLQLIEGLKSPEIKVITVSGESGIGKSLVLQSVMNDIDSKSIVWLHGTCTQITQLSPLGYFQDMLLGFFNVNNFCPDTLQLKKHSIKFFKQDFPSLNNGEILDLLNLLYPENTDKYEHIYFNKAKTIVILKKIISTIAEKMKIIFIVDKSEYIDGMSIDLFREILKDEAVYKRCKIVSVTSSVKPGMGTFVSDSLTANNYLDLAIAPFTNLQTEEFLKQLTGKKYNTDFVGFVNKVSNGIPANIEQITLFKKDIARANLKDLKCSTMTSIVETRLNILKQEDWKAYRFLIAASVLGIKFYPLILESFDNLASQGFDTMLETLVGRGFIKQVNSLSFEFKTEELWKTVATHAKEEQCFDEILNTLFEILNMYKHSSLALLGYILQKTNNYDKAFDVWTLLMKQASYIGDIGLYIIVQRQSLKLIENKNSAFYKKVKKNISTRVGKLLEPIDHVLSFEYLQNAIMLIDDWEDAAHIELLGYIASCSMKMGNYFGTIECIEKVISKLPENMVFERNLVRSKTARPLLLTGNYGQLVNLIETELLNEIEPVLNKGRDTSVIKIKDLFYNWLDLYFCLAEALVLQGNNRAFDVIQTIYEVFEKNKTIEPEIICQANLLLALANTLKGNIVDSNKILNDILKEFQLDSMKPQTVSRWNFIDILNKFFVKDYEVLKSELFEVVTYANNINDNFTKNILKTLLAHILYESGQSKKALEILDEQVTYFAKEKISTGVLLSWYLIAKNKLASNFTVYALDIATKALDIAQGPNINNYYFVALFNMLIGEIYISKQDFESAKVYLEKSIFVAKQFGLEYILVQTYLKCAHLYRELALPKTNSRLTYIKQALKMYQIAKNIDIVKNQPALQKIIKEDLNILISFCKLNRIILKNKASD
ncbi:MAG: hypothetical protein MJ237_09135 [bacterium]|nr:hypothetical protein [bacterium]